MSDRRESGIRRLGFLAISRYSVSSQVSLDTPMQPEYLFRSSILTSQTQRHRDQAINLQRHLVNES